MQITLGFKERI